MFRVAICDSDPLILEQIEKIIGRYPEIYRCDKYSDTEDLLRFLEYGEKYEMAILDLEWRGTLKGIETGTQMGRLYPEIKVVYMAEHPVDVIQQMFLKLPNLSGFLIKPIEERILQEYLEKNMELEQVGQNDSLLIKKKGRVKAVRFDDIIYLESDGHLIKVWTREDQHECYGRLGEFVKRLPEYFIQCHKSYLVNMNEIKEINGNQIVLQGEKRIPVSKSRNQDTKRRFYSYISSIYAQREKNNNK